MAHRSLPHASRAPNLQTIRRGWSISKIDGPRNDKLLEPFVVLEERVDFRGRGRLYVV